MCTLLTRERARASDHLANLYNELSHIAMGYSVALALIVSVICLTTLSEFSNLGLAII
jgi:hypothetical protein